MAYLIPTIHPAAVLHGTRPIGDVIAADLGKAHRIAAGDGPNLEEHIIHVIPGNPLGIDEALRHALAWLESWATRPCRIGVDVETPALDYFNCKLYSIALGEADSGVAVAFTLKDFHTLPPSYERALERALRAVLAHEQAVKVFHNAPFDMAVLYHKGFYVGGKILDTQGLHHLVQPDIPHDLGWVGHTYLDVEPWKLDHESGKMANTKDPVKLLVYNARDALYTDMLVPHLFEHIEALGMPSELAYWQAEYARLATDMENYGLPVHFGNRQQRATLLRNRMAEKRQWLRDYLQWPDFNPMADVHRREVIYGKKYSQPPYNLGLQPTKYTKKTQKPSTSYKAIIDHLEHPFVRNLADYVESHMAYATQFRDGTLLDLDGKREQPGGYQRAICPDGRLHPRWKANTLRSVRYGSDPNVQNQRALAPGAEPLTCDRYMFEAPPGRVFVGSDKDQLELRIHAVRAGETELLKEMLRPGGDPHTLACKMVYGETFAKQDKKGQKMLRTIMKNVVYASLYLAGVTTVWRTIRERKQLDPAIRAAMTLPVVRHAHSSYFMHFSRINRFNEWLVEQAETVGHITIPPFRRMRYFPIKPVPGTEVCNWHTQCYTESAKIHTVDGLSKITECDGKTVILPTGVLARASLLKMGESETVVVKLNGGSWQHRVTPSHEWLCQDSERTFYKEAQDLTPGDLICTPLSNRPFGHRPERHEGWPFWLAAWISDGHTVDYGYDLYFGINKNNRDKNLCWRFFKFACQMEWKPQRPVLEKQNLMRVRIGQGRSCPGRKRFLEDMRAWGYHPQWTSHTKRVPDAVFSSGVWGARQFLWGMLEADFGQGNSRGAKKERNVYTLHSCNHSLLRDILGLAYYAGIGASLYGPRHPDKRRPAATSWELILHAFDVDNLFYPNRFGTRRRQRCSNGPLAPREECDRFLQNVEASVYSNRHPYRTLHNRLRSGGSVDPWTLREMYALAEAPIPPLHTALEAADYPVPMGSKEPVYTLKVQHPLHQYVAEGTVTKNCCGAEIVTSEMCQVQYELKRRYGHTASIIAHKHDELNIECEEKDAEAIAKLVKDVFGKTKLDGPAGPVYLTADVNISRNMATLK